MEFQKVLENRRSIRQYEAGKKVSRQDIEEMIRAAQLAPTWKNSETGRYYCIMDEERLQSFREICLPEFNANNTENVSALIVTTFVANRSGYDIKTNTPSNELENGWGCYDLGFQCENLLLKAQDLGISTLVMGIRDAAKIRQFLQIPEEEIIVSVIAAGYSQAEPAMPRRKNLEDIVKFF